MKSVSVIFLCAVLSSFCLFACSRTPKEPVSTTVVKYSYVNPYNRNPSVPETAETRAPGSEGKTEPESAQRTEKVNNIDCVFQNRYVYENSVGEITNIDFRDNGISINADAYADVKIDEIGSRKKNLKIGYSAYDGNGTLVRNSYLIARLDGVEEGDVVKGCRFNFPRESVKIIFFDYVESDD